MRTGRRTSSSGVWLRLLAFFIVAPAAAHFDLLVRADDTAESNAIVKGPGDRRQPLKIRAWQVRQCDDPWDGDALRSRPHRICLEPSVGARRPSTCLKRITDGHYDEPPQ